jgi:hypothetical protein
MVRRGSEEYAKADMKMFGETRGMKRPLTDSIEKQQFEDLGKKIKCMRKSKKIKQNSGEINQRGSGQFNGNVDHDELDKGRKMI